MNEEKSTSTSFDQSREIMERFSTEKKYAVRQQVTSSDGEIFYFNFLLRCQRNAGKQVSYAKVWLTESDGTTPFKPESLYLGVTAGNSILTRNTNVSELEAMVTAEIEDGEIGYVVVATANSYGPDAESSDTLDECAKA